MTTDPQVDESHQSSNAGQGARAWTLRAVVLGALLAAGYSILVPWNDWILRNTLLYNNYMPQAVTALILVIVLGLNPLLGRRRLRMGELGVMMIMLLGIGGVVSSGLARYWSTSVAYPAKLLSEKSAYKILQVPLDEAGLAAAEADFRTGIAFQVRRFDRNGDGALDATERQAAGAPEPSDPNAPLTAQAWADQALAAKPSPLPSTRWALDPDLFLSIPEHGPINSADAEFSYIIGGYFQGLPSTGGEPTVGHRCRVSWTAADGSKQTGVLALSGDARINHQLDGILDLDQTDLGRALRGLRATDRAGVDTGRRYRTVADDNLTSIATTVYQDASVAEILARSNGLRAHGLTKVLPAGTELSLPDLITIDAVDPAGTPWGEWLRVGLAWAPLLFGAILAMVALAAIVHHQWRHNERLPYPIAAVACDLIRDAEPGKRWPALFRARLFWVGFLIAISILYFNALHTLGTIPFGIKLSWMPDLISGNTPWKGDPWNKVMRYSHLFGPTIYLSMIALAFFMAADVSFSIWFFFIFANVFFMVCKLQGLPVSSSDISAASMGGYLPFVAIILWVGRSYYWGLVKAAFRGGDMPPEIRRGRFYVWLLIIGTGLMFSFFLFYGTGVFEALLYCLLFLGTMLVLSRMVAESGVPFIQVPGGMFFNSTLFSLIGVSAPATALMPLTLLGLTLMADNRESVMPYAVNANYIAERSGVPWHRGQAAFLIMAIVGAVLAIGTMVYCYYQGAWVNGQDGWAPMRVTRALDPVKKGLEAMSTTEGAIQYGLRRQETIWAFAIGAALTCGLILGRMRFSWWPLHPMGFLLCTCWPIASVWFSVLIGWLAKVSVMRYGGTDLFLRLRPLAIGLIAGEALVGMMLLGVRIFYHLLGQDFPKINILPG